MANIGRTFSALAKSAVLGAALTAVAAPAMADGFSFGYTHASPHRYHHHRHARPHAYAWGPRVVFVAPPRVVYRTPAPVVVVPPPAAPLAVDPASEPYRTADGRYCREYTSTVIVGGQAQPSYGTACQMPDGTWHIVN